MTLAALDALMSHADAKPQRQPIAIAVFSFSALRELIREMKREDEREHDEIRALAALDDVLDDRDADGAGIAKVAQEGPIATETGDAE